MEGTVRIFNTLSSAKGAEHQLMSFPQENYWIRFQSSDHLIFEVLASLFRGSSVIPTMLTDSTPELEFCDRRWMLSSPFAVGGNFPFLNKTPIDVVFTASEFQMTLEALVNLHERQPEVFVNRAAPDVVAVIKSFMFNSTLEHIRKTYNILNDFSEEENKQIRAESLDIRK